MQMGYYFDQTRCTGCKACVVACKDWYDTPLGDASRIKIFYAEINKWPTVGVKYLTATCYQCEDPVCVDACTDNAMSKRENGIVDVDPELCVGLDNCKGGCLKSCPYNAPQFSEVENPKMWKCDLCADRLEKDQPAICDEACPTRAIVVAPLDELKETYGDAAIERARGRKLNDGDEFFYSTRTKPAVVMKSKVVATT